MRRVEFHTKNENKFFVCVMLFAEGFKMIQPALKKVIGINSILTV